MGETIDDPLIARSRHRIGVALVVSFWALHYILLTGARAIQYLESDWSMALPRMIVVACAILVSLGILRIHERVRGVGLAERLALTVATALVGCALHFVINYEVFSLFRPDALAGESKEYSMEIGGYALAIVDWFWSYLSLSAILMTLRYHGERVDRDLSLARLETLARGAQLKALRYQLNPHFLFNALNSIAALVSRGEAKQSEEMVENLADFLRASLAIDANEDIALAREIALQRLYLAVEAVRFPKRLKVKWEIDAEVEEARVPSLILQPPIENAIKYAVAGSLAPVTLTIEARPAGNRLALAVRDDGGDSEAAAGGGTGVGLANVADRLRALFGEDHVFTAGPVAGGGFAVAIELPLRFAKVHRDA